MSMLMALGLYAAVFAGPFVQEDVAVLGGAAVAQASPNPPLVYIALLAGLVTSDSWKYAAGRLARRWQFVADMANRPTAQRFLRIINARLGVALLTARFVPGTRIPLYVLAGVERAPMLKFAVFLVLSAIAYIALAAGLVTLIGPKAAAGLTVTALLAVVLLAVWAKFRPKPA
jgi:membrane protein DedA with SNARE-associated domain